MSDGYKQKKQDLSTTHIGPSACVLRCMTIDNRTTHRTCHTHRRSTIQGVNVIQFLLFKKLENRPVVYPDRSTHNNMCQDTLHRKTMDVGVLRQVIFCRCVALYSNYAVISIKIK